MFTEDSSAAMLGVDRSIRYLLSWHAVTTRFNILMAHPRKRQLGCVMTWIGAVFLAVGLVTVALQKRIRAIDSLKVFMAGKRTQSLLQKLLGLLEHFCHVFALERCMMAHMRDSLQMPTVDGETVLRHPEALVSPSRPELSMAGKWIKFLSHCAGSAASVFAAEQVPLSVLSQIMDWHSDAAVEETDLGVGLGGWAAGYWWRCTLSQTARLIPVPILELIGLAVNFFVFGELFVNVVHKECTLLLHCDSLA